MWSRTDVADAWSRLIPETLTSPARSATSSTLGTLDDSDSERSTPGERVVPPSARCSASAWAEMSSQASATSASTGSAIIASAHRRNRSDSLATLGVGRAARVSAAHRSVKLSSKGSDDPGSAPSSCASETADAIRRIRNAMVRTTAGVDISRQRPERPVGPGRLDPARHRWYLCCDVRARRSRARSARRCQTLPRLVARRPMRHLIMEVTSRKETP